MSVYQIPETHRILSADLQLTTVDTDEIQKSIRHTFDVHYLARIPILDRIRTDGVAYSYDLSKAPRFDSSAPLHRIPRYCDLLLSISVKHRVLGTSLPFTVIFESMGMAAFRMRTKIHSSISDGTGCALLMNLNFNEFNRTALFVSTPEVPTDTDVAIIITGANLTDNGRDKIKAAVTAAPDDVSTFCSVIAGRYFVYMNGQLVEVGEDVAAGDVDTLVGRVPIQPYEVDVSTGELTKCAR